MGISLLEAGMLICFGLAWPVNIYKSLKSKTTKGKSLMFLCVVFAGYIFGILHKLIFSRDIVLMLYIINIIMVGTDIVLFYINAQRDRLRENTQN